MKIKNIQNILKVPAVLCLTGITTALFTVSVSAQNAELDTFQDTLISIQGIVNTTTIILVGIAFLFFFWNLGRYILKGGEEKDKARDGMVWGIIAIIVLTSLWGIIVFVRNLAGIEAGVSNDIPLPGVTFPSN